MAAWPTITDGVTRLGNALFTSIKAYIDDLVGGQGLPVGGATNDILAKTSSTNYAVAWTDAPTVDSVTLDTAAAEATGIAKIFWDATEGTVAFGMAGGVVTQQIGRQEFVRCKNTTASQINRGQIVYLTGASGDRPTIALADATDETTSAETIGIAAEDIAASAEGEICISGILANVNTYGLTAGVMTYLSETPGAWTQTRPTQPAHGVRLGIPLKISNSPSGNSGVFFVQINNGYEFEELHDVLITTATAGDILKRNAGNTLWVNTAPAALTKTDDTNVTLTLGGSASTALVNAASITAGWTGQLAIARGGTGASTAQAAINALAGAVTSGSYLRGNGTNVVMSTIQAGDVPTLNQNTTGSAATLTTARTLWGNSFDGSANVTGAIQLGAGAVGAPSLTFSGDLNTGVWSPAADVIALSTNGAERLRADNSGNIGQGVTPSAWASGWVAYQIGSAAALVGRTINAGVYITSNAYFDGTDYRYITTDFASYTRQYQGEHLFYTAASGTAGAIPAFTTQLRITASGDLAIDSTKKILLDSTIGTGDTYITESASNTLDLVAGGVTFRHTTTALRLTTNDAASLGISGTAWADLFLASGGVVDWNAGNTTLTHSAGKLTIAGSGAGALDVKGAVSPTANDGAALGSGTVSWADLFLASGGVLNFNNGDVTVTHSADTLTFAGAATGYVFNNGPVTVGLGTVSAPTLTFSGDLNTGIWSPAADTVAASTNGTERMRIDSAGRIGIGVTPTSTWDTASSHVLQMNGGSLWSFSTSQINLVQNLSYDGTNFKYVNTAASSAYRQISGDHQFHTAPSGTAANTATLTERFRVLNGGDIAIGATAKLYLDGVTGAGNTYITESSADVVRIYTGGVDRFVLSTTQCYINVAYSQTTASAANVNVAADGLLARSTSSIRYKHDIDTLDSDQAMAAVMAMRPVTYRGKDDADQRHYVGFIAEEMSEIAPLLCTYDEGGESGTPNYVTYDRVAAYLVAVVQHQQTEIAALKARLN